MKELPLRNGGVALVDDEDYPYLRKFNWRWLMTGSKKYVGRYGWTEKKTSRVFYLHRVIMEAKGRICVDHINGDTFDNRRENLRFSTYAENARNCKIYKSNTTGYKGVQRQGDKFKVEIQYNRIRLRSDSFESPEEAAAFYNEVTARLFGEFANPNPLPDEITEADLRLF